MGTTTGARSGVLLGALGVLALLAVMAFGRAGPADDYQLPETGVVADDVPVDRSFTLVSKRAGIELQEGVVKNAMTFDGTLPGPLLVVEEGDVVEITLRNEDDVPHGLSIHAAYMYSSGQISDVRPGQEKTIRFRATVPGVYMYHCAAGGQAIMTHTIAGQYGMIVVEPKSDTYRLEDELGREPDVKMYMLQHEVYASGKDAWENRPLYVAFNGRNYRYVEEPIVAQPGDYVRAYYLNVGPNLTGTFHLVGIIWDYMYYQGHPRNLQYGGQSTVAGPTDSWVVEFRVPEAGAYGIVTHAMGSQTPRGAMGMLMAEEGAERTAVVSSQGKAPLLEGPVTLNALNEARAYANGEDNGGGNGYLNGVRRLVDPFAPGTPDVDEPVRFNGDDRPVIRTILNSYWPKVVEVPAGTEVTWIQEDNFDFLAGEYTGQHNVVGVSGPQRFASELMKHADQYSHTFTEPGDYEYVCSLHPYMRGIVRVR
jgi:nitrite reductase (NO-forming)